jgi:hypothetical protein
MRKLTLAFAMLACLARGASPQEARPRAATLSVELGGGAWLGDFREHLDRDGAYLFTPALDFSARFPIGRYLGVEALIGSACVIHRYSEPIDGSFIYQQAGVYAAFPIGPCSARIAAEAGFEHGTLLITQYSSGVAGASLSLDGPISDRLSWVATIRFRRGFLQAVTIPDYYGTDIIDKPTSLTLSMGLSWNI